MVIFHSHVSLPEGNMQTLSLTLSLTINLIIVIFHSHVNLLEGNMQTLSLTLSLTINLIIVMFHSHGTFTRGYVSFHSHPLLLKMFPIAIQLYPTPRQFAQRWLNSMRSEHHVCCLNPMV